MSVFNDCTGIKIDFEIKSHKTGTVVTGTKKFDTSNHEMVLSEFFKEFPESEFKVNKFSSILCFGEADLICG